MAQTEIFVIKFLVYALANPSQVSQNISRLIDRGVVDEGSALITFALQPEIKAHVELEEEYQIDKVQVVAKFELIHNSEIIWTTYSPEIITEKSFYFHILPSSLADLSKLRQQRKMSGVWSMKASFGILDLIEFTQLSPRRAATFIKNFPFSEVGTINWSVTQQGGKLNNKGQFQKAISNGNKTYSMDEI